MDEQHALLDFSGMQYIEFDTLLPLYIAPLGRDSRFNSTSDVGHVVLMMPVKERHDRYYDIYNGKEESVHDFLWIMQ
ncbi:hypothetical protein DVH05_014886 [Phytophthora capsici]|nr:hypothetical protein DVH05_014886 [Phytophthora capsici]